MRPPELKLLRDSLMWHQLDDWVRERAIALCDYMLAHEDIKLPVFRFNIYTDVNVTVETYGGPKEFVGKITGRVYKEKHSEKGEPTQEVGYWIWIKDLESTVKTVYFNDSQVRPLK